MLCVVTDDLANKENEDCSNVASCSTSFYNMQQPARSAVPLVNTAFTTKASGTPSPVAAELSNSRTPSAAAAPQATPQTQVGSRMARARELHIEQSVVLQQETNVLLGKLVSVLEDIRDISKQRLQVAERQLQYGNVVVQYSSGDISSST
jgi:hypothetical protein